VAVTLATTLTPTTASATGGTTRQTYTGSIDGADYRVEVPEGWNGTLLLYSHGYAPEGFPSDIAVTNRPVPYGAATEAELLDRGYALAASNFKGVYGYQVEQGTVDQLALLDWFTDHVGRPRHTIATGQSLGAAIAVRLAERHPQRIQGVTTFCAGYDPAGTWNAALDITFVVRTLLAPGEQIKLTGFADTAEAEQSMLALHAAIDRAAATPEGRARLAFAGAVNNVTGWYSARFPEPTTFDEFVEQQKEWVKWAYSFLGTVGRVDLERRAGGNPSWNTGIDYGRQLSRSAHTRRVERAYREAGLSLQDDLKALATAPRIGADRRAVRYLYHNGVATGRLRQPMVSVHSTGDGGAVADQERWYAGQVRRHGQPWKLRQLYVHRGGHCTISGAEEILAVRAVDQRLRTGHWTSLAPTRLNAAAAALDPDLQQVFDFSTFSDAPDVPRFTTYTPPVFLRPSR
jgi:pimeloyl-ACP methyl ester carboxylesterase